MPAYYDPRAALPGLQWSKTVYPRVLRSPELWLCLATHAALTALLRTGHLELPGEHGALVPTELAAALLCLALLATAEVTRCCQRWREAMTDACVRVGEQTRFFVQELQATFGRAEELLPLRFAAAKYALAGVYLFFFAVTGGAVTARAWGELRAKGLLDDREVQFLEGQYGGDRLALLHVWASWAAQEAAAALAARRCAGGPSVLAGGLDRLARALQGAAAAAHEAAGLAAAPVPYPQFQLQRALTLASALALAALAAPAAAGGPEGGGGPGFAASAAYVAVLVALLGLRETAALLSDPLCRGHGFPVAATVNATADAVAQLLAAGVPAAFDPRPAWRDAKHAVFSQGQIERRTPSAAFAGGRANPWHWREVEPAVAGDQAPPPLLDIGCCHLDVEALPRAGGGARRRPSQQLSAPRPRQDGAGALLARLQPASKGGGSTRSSAGTSVSSSSEAGAAARPGGSKSSAGGSSEPRRERAASPALLPSLPRAGPLGPHPHHPSIAGASRAHRGLARSTGGGGAAAGGGSARTSLGGTWANPAEEPRARGGGAVRVSPGEAAPGPAAPPAGRRSLQL